VVHSQVEPCTQKMVGCVIACILTSSAVQVAHRRSHASTHHPPQPQRNNSSDPTRKHRTNSWTRQGSSGTRRTQILIRKTQLRTIPMRMESHASGVSATRVEMRMEHLPVKSSSYAFRVTHTDVTLNRALRTTRYPCGINNKTSVIVPRVGKPRISTLSQT
jgi:hypothetical protein